MTDDIAEGGTNDYAILIRGGSGEGKSASLRNIRDQKDWMVTNTEAGKKLPFRNQFNVFPITDPYEVYAAIDAIHAAPEDWKGLVVDTASFLMDQFESAYIVGAANGQKAWGDYAQFFKNLMQQYIGKLDCPVLMLSHAREMVNEASGERIIQAAVKGSLANHGMEAYFTTVISVKKMSIKDLEAQPYDDQLLRITEDERIDGYKHVFQTRPTKKTVGERIRSPIGMFTREQTFMDNDAQLLLDHVKAYYAV